MTAEVISQQEVSSRVFSHVAIGFEKAGNALAVINEVRSAVREYFVSQKERSIEALLELVLNTVYGPEPTHEENLLIYRFKNNHGWRRAKNGAEALLIVQAKNVWERKFNRALLRARLEQMAADWAPDFTNASGKFVIAGVLAVVGSVLLGLLNPEEAYADFPDTHDACTQQQLEGGYNCKTLILDEDELGCYTMQQENGYKDGQYFTDSWWQECDRNGKPKGKKHDYDRFKYIAWTENMPTWSASDIDKYTRAMGHPPNPPSRMEWLRFFQPERYAEEIESQQQIQIRYGQPTRTAKPTLTPTGIPLPTNTPEPPTSTPEPTATSVPTQEVAIVELPSENKSEIAPGLGQATALPGPEWLTATPVPTNIPIAKVEEGDLVENDIEKQRVAVEEVEDRESEKSNDGDNLKLLGISTTAVGIAGIGIWKIRARIARRLNSFTSRQVSTLAIEDGKASLKYIDKAKIRLLLSTYGSRITEVPIGNNRKQRIYLIFTVEGNAGSETIKAWIIDFNTTLSHSRVVGQEINQLHGVPVVSKQVNGTASSSVIADFKRIAVSDLINRNIAYYLGRYRARIPEESNWI